MVKNKLIVVESGDRLGKGTLVRGISEYYDYKNIAIRHCDKPPKDISKDEILDYQIKAFTQEFEFISYVQKMNRKFMYHNNTIIYDRFYPGEYVYGQLFRGYDPKVIKNNILALEEKYIKDINKYSDIFLITLTAEPEFFFSKEDGKSFSQNIQDKTKELELFKEIHNLSTIPNKLLFQVDEDGQFLQKETVLNSIINFIEQ